MNPGIGNWMEWSGRQQGRGTGTGGVRRGSWRTAPRHSIIVKQLRDFRVPRCCCCCLPAMLRCLFLGVARFGSTLFLAKCLADSSWAETQGIHKFPCECWKVADRICIRNRNRIRNIWNVYATNVIVPLSPSLLPTPRLTTLILQLALVIQSINIIIRRCLSVCGTVCVCVAAAVAINYNN